MVITTQEYQRILQKGEDRVAQRSSDQITSGDVAKVNRYRLDQGYDTVLKFSNTRGWKEDIPSRTLLTQAGARQLARESIAPFTRTEAQKREAAVTVRAAPPKAAIPGLKPTREPTAAYLLQQIRQQGLSGEAAKQFVLSQSPQARLTEEKIKKQGIKVSSKKTGKISVLDAKISEIKSKMALGLISKEKGNTQIKQIKKQKEDFKKLGIKEPQVEYTDYTTTISGAIPLAEGVTETTVIRVQEPVKLPKALPKERVVPLTKRQQASKKEKEFLAKTIQIIDNWGKKASDKVGNLNIFTEKPSDSRKKRIAREIAKGVSQTLVEFPFLASELTVSTYALQRSLTSNPLKTLKELKDAGVITTKQFKELSEAGVDTIKKSIKGDKSAQDTFAINAGIMAVLIGADAPVRILKKIKGKASSSVTRLVNVVKKQEGRRIYTLKKERTKAKKNIKDAEKVFNTAKRIGADNKTIKQAKDILDKAKSDLSKLDKSIKKREGKTKAPKVTPVRVDVDQTRARLEAVTRRFAPRPLKRKGKPKTKEVRVKVPTKQQKKLITERIKKSRDSIDDLKKKSKTLSKKERKKIRKQIRAKLKEIEKLKLAYDLTPVKRKAVKGKAPKQPKRLTKPKKKPTKKKKVETEKGIKLIKAGKKIIALETKAPKRKKAKKKTKEEKKIGKEQRRAKRKEKALRKEVIQKLDIPSTVADLVVQIFRDKKGRLMLKPQLKYKVKYKTLQKDPVIRRLPKPKFTKFEGTIRYSKPILLTQQSVSSKDLRTKVNKLIEKQLPDLRKKIFEKERIKIKKAAETAKKPKIKAVPRTKAAQEPTTAQVPKVISKTVSKPKPPKKPQKKKTPKKPVKKVPVKPIKPKKPAKTPTRPKKPIKVVRTKPAPKKPKRVALLPPLKIKKVGKKAKVSRKPSKKAKPEYTPSLAAILEGITGKRPKSITGFELRPLPSSKKRTLMQKCKAGDKNACRLLIKKKKNKKR